jgi:hypothetical protein
MNCPLCAKHHYEILKRKTSTGAYVNKSYDYIKTGAKQAWVKFLCHHCHFVWTMHFNFGRKEVVEMLQDGGKIRAIKMYRMATGEGLYESKKYIDEIADEIGYKYHATVEGVATSRSRSEENIT